MASEMVRLFYLCSNCMEPADEPTPCPNCGAERIPCRPGELDDPGRKPYMSPAGVIISRAPIWWLQAKGTLDR